MSVSVRARAFKYISIISIPFIFMLLASGCATNGKGARSKDGARAAQGNQSRVNSVLKTAFSQVGNPYRYGGDTPETGFDCSGFVRWVYQQYDVELPRHSGHMLSVGTPVAREELRPGDLVFFGRKRVSHVGIYTGDNKYIHSPRTGKSIQESSLDYRGRGERFLGARRVINNEGVTNVGENLKQAWVQQSRRMVAADNKSSSARKGQPAGSANKAAAKRHKVKSGDTLYALSKKYGISSEALARANKLNGKRKNQLKLGQTLIVPVRSN